MMMQCYLFRSPAAVFISRRDACVMQRIFRLLFGHLHAGVAVVLAIK